MNNYQCLLEEEEIMNLESEGKFNNLIMNKEKILGKIEFDYDKFLFRWCNLGTLTFLVCGLGFIFRNRTLDSTTRTILLIFICVCAVLGIYVSAKFYLMNKELDILKKKWMNFYLSFFWLVLAIIYSCVSICFSYFASKNILELNITGILFYIIFPLMFINFWLFFSWYAKPVFKIFQEISKSNASNQFDGKK